MMPVDSDKHTQKQTLYLVVAAALVLGVSLLLWRWQTGPSSVVIHNESSGVLAAVSLDGEVIFQYPRWSATVADIPPGAEVTIQVPEHVSDYDLTLSFSSRDEVHSKTAEAFFNYPNGRTRNVFRVDESLAVESRCEIIGFRR